MFRNSAWSRAFLAELSEYAHLGEDALLEMRPVSPPPPGPPSRAHIPPLIFISVTRHTCISSFQGCWCLHEETRMCTASFLNMFAGLC